LATPLQICAVAATIANGGKYYRPRIVKKAIAEDGKVIIEDKPKLELDLCQAGIKPGDLELIRKGMWMAVNQAGGTCGKVKHPTVDISAKSGTAQTVDNGVKSNNSWIMAFAPHENPKYAICIMVQNAGSGGGICGPLVNLVYRGIFAQDAGVKLPFNRQTEVLGNLDRIEKTIEIAPEMIASVEAGDQTPAPEAITAAAAETQLSDSADIGETGEEVGEVIPGVNPPPGDDAVTPAPTITPEVDAEGSAIPKAVPVSE
jgi:penicillin-binding protein 2